MVVGYDGSGASRTAIRWAVAEARRQGRPLRVLHAHTYPLAAVPSRTIIPVAGLAENARVVEEQGAAIARESAPGLPVTVAVVDDHAAQALVEASHESALVVVGARGRRGFVALRLGSVSDHVAGHADCPVAVIHDDGDASTADVGPVVVGMDGSDLSNAAVGYAFAHAAETGATVLAVHAWAPYYSAWAVGAVPVAVEPPESPDMEEDQLAESLAPWRAKYGAVRVERRVVLSPAVDALLAAATDASLVVIGSHGRGALATLALGSVSHGVLHGVTCPVVVVRGRR